MQKVQESALKYKIVRTINTHKIMIIKHKRKTEDKSARMHKNKPMFYAGHLTRSYIHQNIFQITFVNSK